MIEDLKKDELLLKCLQGKADEQEYEAAYKWITADKSNYTYYERIRDAWIAAGIVTNISEHNCNKAWRKIARRTGVRWFNTSGITLGFRNIAAVFIIALTLGAFSVHYYYYYSNKEIFTERDIVVQAPLGAKTYMIFPDNTKVWLNAGSTLKYSTHYDITQRSVQLTGEAYFDVESSSKLPFRVYAHDLVINALGTEFNVKAYPEEKQVETTLVSGLVSLERKVAGGDDEKVLLRPNQRAYSSHGETKIGVFNEPDEPDEIIKEKDEVIKELEVKPVQPMDRIAVEKVVNTKVYTSWKDKRFIFEREPMSDLAVKMERIYDVKITFKDEELKDYNLSGSLEQETIEQLLYAIRLTIPLDFAIKNNEVVFSLNQELKEKYNNIQN